MIRLRGRRERALLALGAFFFVLTVLVFVDPRTARFAPVCPLNATTGLFCPGCGTGRALHALVHGDLGRALRLNVLAVAAVPVFLVLALRAALRPERRLPVPPRWLRVAIYLLLAFFFVARNLPFEPFATWAPREVVAPRGTRRPPFAGRVGAGPSPFTGACRPGSGRAGAA